MPVCKRLKRQLWVSLFGLTRMLCTAQIFTYAYEFWVYSLVYVTNAPTTSINIVSPCVLSPGALNIERSAASQKRYCTFEFVFWPPQRAIWSCCLELTATYSLDIRSSRRIKSSSRGPRRIGGLEADVPTGIDEKRRVAWVHGKYQWESAYGNRELTWSGPEQRIVGAFLI